MRDRVGVVCAAAVFLAAGCGTQVRRPPIDAASSPGASVAGLSPKVQASADSGQAPGVAPGPVAAGMTTTSRGPVAGPVVGGAAKPVEGGRVAGPGRVTGVPARAGGAAPSGGGGGTSPTTSGGGQGASVVPPPTPLSPLRIGSVGAFSGPAGSTTRPFLEGLLVWVKWVNDSGGVNGHLVVLRVYDDGFDPARNRAAHQQAIEKDRVIAFVDSTPAGAGLGGADYLRTKRVPTVGVDTVQQWEAEHPMFFPQAATGKASNYAVIAGIAPRAIAQGKNIMGTLTCVESTACREADEQWNGWAPQLGLKPVYQGKVSIAQPDFTAECLAARNAGVNLFLPAVDTNTIRRVVTSCARQGYRPLFGAIGFTISRDQAPDPDHDGFMTVATTFPFFKGDTPATAEFQTAMRQYAPNVAPGVNHAVAWTGAKLFEKAAAGLTEPPTSEGLLRELWKIKDDTLGGLTQPLTFSENEPRRQFPVCFYDLVVHDKQWRSPDNFQVHCESPR